MKRKLYYLTLLTIIVNSSHLQAKDDANLPINLKFKGGKFDIIYHRSNENAVGSLLFGMFGSVVEENIKSNKDQESLAYINKKLNHPSCDQEFLFHLKKALRQKYKINHTQNKPIKNASTLNIKIKYCGFKIVDSTTAEMSSFILVHSSFSEKGKKGDIEKTYLTGKKKYPFSNITENSHTSMQEFNSVLKKAGRRIANKAIYK